MSNEVVELREALNACLEFLTTELHWEYFRIEFLFFDDEPKARCSAENARLLRNFLSRPEIKKHIEAARL